MSFQVKLPEIVPGWKHRVYETPSGSEMSFDPSSRVLTVFSDFPSGIRRIKYIAQGEPDADGNAPSVGMSIDLGCIPTNDIFFPYLVSEKETKREERKKDKPKEEVVKTPPKIKLAKNGG